MPLQNRVDPFGAIHATKARGLFTGNRGVIHDPATKSLLKRRWATNAWLICVLEWQGRRREPMGRNAPGGGTGWTELFFLDEVTALAAGHRPCFFCQRDRARGFLGSYAQARTIADPHARDLDRELHGQRSAAGAQRVLLGAGDLTGLPDGTMIAVDDKPHAKRGDLLLQWTFDGYRRSTAIPAQAKRIEVLTPRATIDALDHGYQAIWHPSATGLVA